VPPSIFPKRIATPSLLAHVITARFVDGIPLNRQERQLERMGIPLGRGRMAVWAIRLGGTFLVPLVNLLNDNRFAESVIHCDETPLQVLKSDKAPTADHWMCVRAAGTPGRRIVLFDYNPSRGGTVPLRLLDGFHGTLVTDGWQADEGVAQALKLTHAGCMAHAQRKFDEARKAAAPDEHARAALEFIGKLPLIERGLWDRDQPCTPEQRVAIRRQRSAPSWPSFTTGSPRLRPRRSPRVSSARRSPTRSAKGPSSACSSPTATCH
jgi:hypothetical protein